MQAYNIDFISVKMHWYKFRALFKSLPDITEFVKIMGYRSVQITPDMPKTQQQHYRKLKKIYSLPRSESERKIQNELEQAFMNGGDITGIINRR